MLRLLAAVLLAAAAAAQTPKLPKELIQYVADARNLGLTEAQIQENAVKAGWPAADVKQALSSPASPATGDAPPPKVRGVPDDYRIGEGDVIQVSVWRQPEASVESAVVRPDGKISLPLIKEMAITGLTPVEAEKRVMELMSAFIQVPDVAVVVRDIRSKKVYVVGAVNKPGPLPYTYQMTILQALSECGGLTDYAKRKKIYVLRSQGGKQYRLPFNYDAVLKGERMELNIQLQAGDTLVIPN